MGQIDSALSTCCCENDASACAAPVGEAGIEYEPFDAWSDSNLRFFIASACRLGGPRRRLGRSKVHGMSKVAHARHGGPSSSHYRNDDLAPCPLVFDVMLVTPVR